MKILAGILGILGGLLGLFVFVLYLVQGLGLGVPEATGTMDAVVGYVGGLAALTCIGAGIVVLFTPGWMAGVVLFAAALVGVVLGSYVSMTLALIGGMIAIANGRRRLSPDGLQERIELEVRQRYGAGR
jgi:hypothetical protein